MGKSDQDAETRTFTDEAELAAFIGKRPTSIGVAIHVVGPAGEARIVVQPCMAVARRHRDFIHWIAGANCGDWSVAFDDESPLDPEGPYSSKGPTGGRAAGPDGIYKYTVTARDLRDGKKLEVDPDAVIVPY